MKNNQLYGVCFGFLCALYFISCGLIDTAQSKESKHFDLTQLILPVDQWDSMMVEIVEGADTSKLVTWIKGTSFPEKVVLPETSNLPYNLIIKGFINDSIAYAYSYVIQEDHSFVPVDVWAFFQDIPDSFKFTLDSATLVLGDDKNNSEQNLFSQSYSQLFSCTSDNQQIVTIKSSEIAVAQGEGVAQIVCFAKNDSAVKDTIAIKVVSAAQYSAKSFIEFGFVNSDVKAHIDQAKNSLEITLPFGTDVTKLIAIFKTSGVSVKIKGVIQQSGTTANNFTNEVSYVVSAMDGTQNIYSIKVMLEPIEINFDSQGADTVANPIKVALYYPQTTLDTLIPRSPYKSGYTFAGWYTESMGRGVQYDEKSKIISSLTLYAKWLNTAKEITKFSVKGGLDSVTIADSIITLSVPFGTNVSELVANFTITGISIKVGTVSQNSGLSVNDFTNPVTYRVTAEDGSVKDYRVTVVVGKSPAKDMIAFGFITPPATGQIIDSSISVVLPYGTNITNLVATYTSTGASVYIGNTEQKSAVTSNDYTNPTMYTVKAADGTIKNYIVTVTIRKNPAKEITEYKFTNLSAVGVVNDSNISVVVPYGTNLGALIANFKTTGATVTVGNNVQLSGTTTNNFTNPVIYKVTADDGSTKNYTVVVTIAKNSAKELTAFGFASPLATGIITDTNIVVSVPFGTNVNALVASYTINGVSVSVGGITQNNGVSVVNFTNPVLYRVLADDGSAKTFRVTVVVSKNPAKELLTFSFSNPIAIGSIIGTNISVTVASSENLTSLVADFTTTGVSVTVGGNVQTSGSTANDFTNPVVYKVTADNGTTQDYTVTVTRLSPLTDTRDGHVYKTVKIGSQIWMAENLAYLPKVDSISHSSNDIGMEDEQFYYVYGYYPVGTTKTEQINNAKTHQNYKSYGVLYDWNASKVSCPTGWHLPDTADWTKLVSNVGIISTVGVELKSITNWNNDGNGLDNYGFAAFPGGYGYLGQFLSIGNYGGWYTTIGTLYSKAHNIGLYNNKNELVVSYNHVFHAFSVRCLKN